MTTLQEHCSECGYRTCQCKRIKPQTTTHTPGPWKVGFSSSKGNVPIYGKNNEHIAWLDGSAHMSGVWSKHGEANARLIAAAPQMLEALKYLVHLVGKENVPGDILTLITAATREGGQ